MKRSRFSRALHADVQPAMGHGFTRIFTDKKIGVDPWNPCESVANGGYPSRNTSPYLWNGLLSVLMRCSTVCGTKTARETAESASAGSRPAAGPVTGFWCRSLHNGKLSGDQREYNPHHASCFRNAPGSLRERRVHRERRNGRGLPRNRHAPG